MADGADNKARRRVSFGALLAVAVVISGSVALIVFVAPLMQRFWDKVEEPVKVVVEAPRVKSVEATVEWEENEGENTPYPGWQPVVTPLEHYGSDAGDLRIEATRSALAFDRIEKDAEGWPPDVAGLFENGLQSYRITLKIEFSDDDVRYVQPTRIAVTDRPGVYYLYAPVAGAGEARPAQMRVLESFGTDHLGICALARFETDRLKAEGRQAE